MKRSGFRTVTAVLGSFALLACVANAQSAKTPPYLNPKLPAKVRAADLVHRMTLKEKVTQLVNGARAIPSLNVPAYDWWSESLHGVAVNGTTEFPEPIGLGATFDPSALHAMAKAISIEGRVVHEEAMKHGGSTQFHGLDFWAPNINIVRDPRWGRGQETYGEDPFLTGQLAVAFVKGMQGSNPHYYRVISTPKHFDAYDGPEPDRHFIDEDISLHDLEDTYLPAFRAAVVQGHAGSVMCSYNAVKGQPACANQFLLGQTLRGDWQFKGYVVSDCGAVRDIFDTHHYRPTQPQASAISLERGMDNECIDFGQPRGDSDYMPYLQAVQQGYLSEHAVDTALIRLFTARIKLGMFDPPGMDPYSNINPDQLNSPAHRALALHMANLSMVLLKNDGVLPLKHSIRSIAIVGPLAGQTGVMLGNYSGRPTHIVSVLEGMKAEFPNAKITYVPGTNFLSNQGTPVPDSVFTTPAGKPGLEASYSTALPFGGRRRPAKPFATRTEAGVDLTAANLPAEANGKPMVMVRWSGFLTAPATGNYLIGIRANGFARVSMNGHSVSQAFRGNGNMGWIHLVKGQPVPLNVMYGHMSAGPFKSAGPAKAQLIWSRVTDKPDPAAIAAAKNADVVIAVVGITSHLESEQSNLVQPGFHDGDRTNLKMPAPERALVHAVAATGKPLVVVLLNGSPMAVPWEKQHADAILEAWYPGEEGGAAIAQTLSGKNDPGGHLPETFYQSVRQLPPFVDYSMQGRTYRYFHGTPLWPFGFGLSYTTFKFSDLDMPQATINAGQPLNVAVTVTNTGKVAGDEVAQLYLQFPDVPGRPIRALRGFERVHLAPGASQVVHFHLTRRDLSMVTAVGRIIVVQGPYTVSVGGGQPGTGAPSVTSHFTINGQIGLPN